MKKDITHVAMDGSKRKIVAGILRPGERDPEVRQIPNESRLIRRLFERLKREVPVRARYEAGPSGYELHRQLTALGPMPGDGSVADAGEARGVDQARESPLDRSWRRPSM